MVPSSTKGRNTHISLPLTILLRSFSFFSITELLLIHRLCIMLHLSAPTSISWMLEKREKKSLSFISFSFLFKFYSLYPHNWRPTEWKKYENNEIMCKKGKKQRETKNWNCEETKLIQGMDSNLRFFCVRKRRQLWQQMLRRWLMRGKWR